MSLPRRRLGRTGLEVTQLGYGTALPELMDPDRDEGHAEMLLNAVLDAGINFVDTAPDYGLSEERVGRFISHRRNEYFLATKCGCNVDAAGVQGEWAHIWTGAQLRINIELSLRRMRTDYVDLLQMHLPSVADLENGELVEVLEEIRETGKTRYIGVSTRFPDLMPFARMEIFDVFQIPYSALERRHERAIQEIADLGAGIVVRGGIGGGRSATEQDDDDFWERSGMSALAGDMNRHEFVLRYTHFSSVLSHGDRGYGRSGPFDQQPAHGTDWPFAPGSLPGGQDSARQEWRTARGRMTPIRTFLALAIPLHVAAASNAWAEPADSLSYTLEEIVVTDRRFELPTTSSVATKISLPLERTPLSVGVVTEAQLNRQQAVVLGDALKNISGVNVHTGFGAHDFFVIRGFDSLSSGLVLTEGVQEPEVSFYNTYNLERVEVLKGPGAFVYGGNPLSGAVNLVRKRPLRGRFAVFNASAGRFRSFRGKLDLGWASEAGVAFRGNLLWQNSDNYRRDKENSAFGANPVLSWRLGPTADLEVDLEYFRSEYASDAGLPIVGSKIAEVPRRRSYQSPFDRSNQDTYRARVEYVKRISDHLTLRNKLYYTDLDWPSRGTLFNGAFPNATGSLDLFRTLLILDDQQRLVGNQFETVFGFSKLGLKHQTMAGFEVSRWTDEFALDVAFLPTLDLFSPSETASKPFAIIPGQSSSADARVLTLAPYLVHNVSADQRYDLFVGGRFDYLDYRDDDTDTDRDYRRLSPMFGAVYRLRADWSVYTNLGLGFAPPSSQVAGKRKAEESAQLELGSKLNALDGRIQGTIALYQLKKSNLAIPDDRGILRETGDQRSRGLEIDLSGQIAPGWYGFIAYAYTSAELTDFRESAQVITATGIQLQTVDRSGNTAPFAPEHMLNLWTTRNLSRNGEVSLGARYVGRQFIAADNDFEMRDALLFDLAFRLNMSNTGARFYLKNLTDRDFETRGFGNTSVIPAAPRTFGFELEWAL
jgi:TonB-dependent siderophore receptor